MFQSQNQNGLLSNYNSLLGQQPQQYEEQAQVHQPLLQVAQPHLFQPSTSQQPYLPAAPMFSLPPPAADQMEMMRAAVKAQEKVEKEARRVEREAKKAAKDAKDAAKAALFASLPPGMQPPIGPGRPRKINVDGTSLASSAAGTPMHGFLQPVSMQPSEQIMSNGHQYILKTAHDAEIAEVMEAQATLAKQTLADQDDYYLDMLCSLRAEHDESRQKNMLTSGMGTLFTNVLMQGVPIVIAALAQRALRARQQIPQPSIHPSMYAPMQPAHPFNPQQVAQQIQLSQPIQQVQQMTQEIQTQMPLSTSTSQGLEAQFSLPAQSPATF